MEAELNPKVLECIDAGLDSIGNAGRQIVYWYLAQKRYLKRDAIPGHPIEFVEALKNLFGQGAGILERTIMRELKQAFHLTLGDSLEEVLAMIKGKALSVVAGNHLRSGSAGSKLED